MVPHLVKGEILEKMDRYEEAITEFDATLLLDPENARAHRGRSVALVKLHHYEDAVVALDRALENDTANPDLLACKGYSLYRLNRI